MSDIWAFLLQTLTASGAAVLLLAVKALFRDKLPPKWHFAIWSILGIVMLIPAGLGGRYVLFNWTLVVETLKTILAGDYSFTRVSFPFPVMYALPRTVCDWVFAFYFLGAVIHLAKYALSYIRLRCILRRGWAVEDALRKRIAQLAGQHQVRIRRIVSVPGLPSAFVCGVLRPVLALPADQEIDDKILLHELLHLKQKDTVWSIVICILRSIHWCNPLLVYCAHRAGNDLEARCDQRVLELLEGEDRRDYGKMLLAMANDRFARTPGATCANNGGNNIRRRIEAIARFKLYPAGMELAAVCTAIILALPMILGVEATQVNYHPGHTALSAQTTLASARSVPCTTAAGAFDTYSKAILNQSGVYRAMCAPEDQQAALAESIIDRVEAGRVPEWDIGIDSWPNEQAGYCIYNLRQVGETAYEGLLVFELNYRPDGRSNEYGTMIIGYQNLRVEKEGHRWVAIPLEQIQWMEIIDQQIGWGVLELPACIYSDTAEDFRVDVRVQTIHAVDTIQNDSEIGWLVGYIGSYDLIPRPNAEFDWERYTHSTSITHLGTQEQRNRIGHVGISTAPIYPGEAHPVLTVPSDGTASGSSSDGGSWSSRRLEPGWGPTVELGGGGTSGASEGVCADLPESFAAELYINGDKVAQLNLLPREGEPQ